MKPLFRRTSLAWLALAVVALGALAGAYSQRIGRLERVSVLVAGAKPDAASPTGYKDGTRNLLIPATHQASQPWLIEAQQLAATHRWQLAKTDYDNAPTGRAAHGTAPYRAWLRLVGAAEQKLAGLPAGRALERAALLADPALHLLLGVLAGLLVAWRFGAAPAALLVAGLAVLFPLSLNFHPGHPDEHGLLLACALLALLAVSAALAAHPSRGLSALFLLVAAAFGLLGLRVEPGSLLPVLGGLVLGSVAALGFLPRGRTAWIALGISTVAAAGAWFTLRQTPPAAWGPDVSVLTGRTAAESLSGWLGRDANKLSLWASLLPLLLIPLALWLVRRPTLAEPAKRALWLALGPVVVLAVFASLQLRWWSLLEISLLGLLVAVAAALPAVFTVPRKLTAARLALLALVLPGAIWLWPQDARRNGEEELSPIEARAMIERDLALWLAARSPGATVYAAPALSASLAYYGGLRVIGTPYPGNQDGLALAVRIAGATSVDEMHALVQQRGIRYLVLTSWDGALEEFARAGSDTPQKSLIALLRQWLPPRWLRPVAYELPQIQGFEEDTVFVFEVIEPQENAAALSRLAEYFIDMKQPDLAAAVSQALAQSFGPDAGAMIARAQVALARADGPGLSAALNTLLPAIADGRDEDLTWERRANLALVLAQVKRSDLAKAQVRFCLEEADEDRLRSLSTISLYRLLVLSHAFNIAFTDPAMHAKALALLPDELRARVQK